MVKHPKQNRTQKASVKGKTPVTTQDVPLPAAADADDVDVSDEDIAFVRKAKKRIGFLSKLDTTELNRAVKAQQQQADQAKQKAEQRSVEQDEEEYERQPRQLTKAALAKDDRAKLPVKTASGEVVLDASNIQRTEAVHVPGVTVEDDLETVASKKQKLAAQQRAEVEEEQQRLKRQKREEQPSKSAAKTPEASGPVTQLQAQLAAAPSQDARRQTAREAMAVAASKLLEDPDSHLGELRLLLSLAGDEDSQVARLAMLSLLAVFKDIIPGYRIRLPNETELATKVSKEVQKLRDFESGLLKHYQSYLKALLAAAEARGDNGLAAARIALRCMCTLLITHSHFNYTLDLLQAVVPRMASGDTEMRRMACGAIRELLQQDIEGKVALEAVQLVADLVRRRKCACDPEVVTSLSVLRFPEVKRPDAAAVKAAKLQKRKDDKKREKEKKRKRGPKKDEVDRAFEEAEVGPSIDQQTQTQSAMLEALFETYFRVLKHCVAAGSSTHAAAGQPLSEQRVAKKFPLLAPVLEGLTSYTHLISVDYFGDLMDVFRQLMRAPALPVSERLRCLLTATDILRGQGEALTVDRRDFYTQLYAALLSCPLSQLVEEADTADASDDAAIFSGAADPQGEAAAALLVRAANQMLCETKSSDMARLAAFVKRSASVGLHCTPGATIGLLAVAFRVLRRNPRLATVLEWEGEAPVGGRMYNPSANDPSEAGALAACMWELPLLQQHYHPHVVQAAQTLLALSPGSSKQPSGALTSPELPHELTTSYSTAKGGFRPPPQRPPTRRAQPQMRNANKQTEAFAAKLAGEMGGQPAADGDDAAEQIDFKKYFRDQMQYALNAELRKGLKRRQHLDRLIQEHLAKNRH